MLSDIIAPLSRKKPMQALRVMAIAPGHWHTRSVVIDEPLLTAAIGVPGRDAPLVRPASVRQQTETLLRCYQGELLALQD
jgi:hypothetical protein